MDVVTLRLDPASPLSLEQLAALFTDAYEGYPVPMHVDATGLARMIETSDLDLEAGLVALADGRPIGLCMLSARTAHSSISTSRESASRTAPPSTVPPQAAWCCSRPPP